MVLNYCKIEFLHLLILEKKYQISRETFQIKFIFFSFSYLIINIFYVFSFNNVETVHFQRINITQGFKVSNLYKTKQLSRIEFLDILCHLSLGYCLIH